MRRQPAGFLSLSALILGIHLLGPIAAHAQRHGGGGVGGGGLSGGGRATGVSDKDDLKDFHHAMEVQASTEQVAQFQALMKSTRAAQARLNDLRQLAGKEKDAAKISGSETVFDQALEKARSDNKNFVDGLSSKQKSGLKELTRRLDKAESELAREKNSLDQLLQSANASDLASRGDSVDKALGNFSDQQIILGREMSIDVSAAQGPLLVLAAIKNPLKIANQPVTVGASGSLAQTSAENGQQTFKLALTADLSDLQQNITAVMRGQLNRAENCGQRIDIKRATLAPSAPISVLTMNLHYERWTCVRGLGSSSATEIAEGDGSVEIKLNTVVEAGVLKVKPEFSRIDATGMLGESLKSGVLGDDVRDAASASLLSAMQAGVDFKTVLPPAAQTAATLQSARFQDSGAGVLTVLFGGEVKLSDEQSTLMATQLKATLAAQETSPKSAN